MSMFDLTTSTDRPEDAECFVARDLGGTGAQSFRGVMPKEAIKKLCKNSS